MLRGSIRCSRSRMSSSGSHTNQAPSRATHRTSWAFAALPTHHQPSACCHTGYDGRSWVGHTPCHTSLRPRAMDEVAAVVEAMVLTNQRDVATALAMSVATQPASARALGTAPDGQPKAVAAALAAMQPAAGKEDAARPRSTSHIRSPTALPSSRTCTPRLTCRSRLRPTCHRLNQCRGHTPSRSR